MRGIVRIIEDRRGQRAQKGRRYRIDICPFPVDAAVEQLGGGFERPAHLVAAIRGADRVGAMRGAAVMCLQSVAPEPSCRDHESRPAREGLARIIVVKMSPKRRCWIEPTGQRLRRRNAVERGYLEIEDPLVLR